MQQRVGNKSIVVMYPARKSVAALTAACNKSGLRIVTPLGKLHTTIASNGRSLRPEEMVSMGADERLVVVGVGKIHSSWAIELAPVFPVLFYPKVEALRKMIDAGRSGVHLHMSLAKTSSPDFGAALAKASADLIGLEIRYDRISIEPQSLTNLGKRRRDIRMSQKEDMRRR